MTPIILEAARNTETHTVHFRFVCHSCRLGGAWLDSLNDAERAAYRHQRTQHQEQVRA